MSDGLDWVNQGAETQDEIEQLRVLRAGFLEVAIEIEIEIRELLTEYFVADTIKYELFVDAYESRGTLGTLRERLKVVLNAERDSLTQFSSADADELLSALHELVQHRNQFAHSPMDQVWEWDDKGQPISSEMRIGKRFTASYFTVATARDAYEKARKCDDLIVRCRMAFMRMRHP
jgi:uncharacterized protein YfkK (UPF0435 family)